MPSPSFNRTERESKRPRGAWGGGGGDKSRHSPERETVKRNDFTIQKKKKKKQHKECVTLEQTEQITNKTCQE